ncbi:MAG TPA: LysR family transcriptional regulator, partial [Candidatus Ozemobacteraceae bacterium]|nr:LysR family transcriptional regulator [Candidatus Ozemobacteraceae bacterium]
MADYTLPDLQPLQTFYVAATSRTFTEAAERLCLSQSAVSHAVARLEQSLRLSLFERIGTKSRLTDAGKRLLSSCERVFDELRQCRDELTRRDPHAISGQLRLGTTVEFGNGVLAAKIAPFLQQYPQLDLSLTFSHDLVSPLLAGNLDLIIDCWVHPREDLWQVKLFREKYVLVAAPAFAQTMRLRRLSDLGRVSWLTLDPAGAWWHRLLVQL